MSTTSQTSFEDIFEVLSRDPDGKKFDHVSRYVCKSELYECDLTLDVNIEVYPLEVGQKYLVALANTLNMDNSAGSTKYDANFPGLTNKPSLMDRYDYVMYGKVYKYKDTHVGGQLRVEVYISYGGLLMLLAGDPNKLQELEVDAPVYLLVRKV